MCSPVTPGAVAPLSAAVPSACTPDVLPAVPIDLNSAHRDLEANIDAEPQPKTHRPRVGRRQIGTTQHDMSGFWLWSCFHNGAKSERLEWSATHPMERRHTRTWRDAAPKETVTSTHDEPRWFALYLNWNCGTVYSPSPLTVNAPAVCDTVRLPQPPAVRVPKPAAINAIDAESEEPEPG